MKKPAIIYCCKGISYLCYAIWSVRSLLKFNYEPIEVIVSNEREKNFFVSHCPGVSCCVINADSQGYPAFSYKPFVLVEYLQKIDIQQTEGDIVICDADILWKQDPTPLFHRFKGQSWVHKITAVNLLDYKLELNDISAPNIGLITTYHYIKRYGLSRYPNFRLNAGLFMLEESVFGEMLKNWMRKIYALPPKEMLMSEALMSLTYAEMGLIPVCDKENIKHLGVEKATTNLPVFSFNVAERKDKSQLTGYQTAKHYYGDQRKRMHYEVKEMGLDDDNLSRFVKISVAFKKLQKIPKKAIMKIHNKFVK